MANTSASRWQRWWPFVLLCLLATLRWTLIDSVPALLSTSVSETIGCGSACLLALSVSVLRRSQSPRVADVLQIAIAGAMMLGGPLVALMLSAHWVDGSDITISLAIVPVVVAVSRPVFRPTEGAALAGRMWPGIVAITGMLLVLPQPMLGSWRAYCLLAAAPLVTGVGAAWFRSCGGGKAWRSTIGLGAVTVVFGTKLVLGGQAMWHTVPAGWSAAAFDGALALLGAMSVLRLGATRWSAQFVLVPLAVMAFSLAAFLPRLDTRLLCGLGLMMLASVFLLLPPKTEEVGYVKFPSQ
jgi:drug/metabolite transporter (DMT)-like permease